MYNPKPFQVDEQAKLYDFIDRHSFGILISTSSHEIVATHLPLLLDREQGVLYGHFAKANKQWEGISEQQVLVIFQGPHHYISSSWYETNQSVPTWNYVAVHAYGHAELVEDERELLATLREQVRKYESEDSIYGLDETNRELIEGLMKGIVGFRIRIERLEGKWKLSQNHSPERRQRVVDALIRIGSEQAAEIARHMQEIDRE